MVLSIEELGLHTPTSGPPMRPDTRENRFADWQLVQAGILDAGSFHEGFAPKANPIEFAVRHGQRHPDPAMRGTLKSIRRTHNGRTNPGGGWLARCFAGKSTALMAQCGKYTATNCTAHSITVAGTPFTASTAVNAPSGGGHNAGQTGISTGGMAGCVIVCDAQGVYAVCLGSTTSVLYFDQWTTIGSTTGAVGTTPGNTSSFEVLPIMAPALWVALSTTALTTANMYTDDTSLAGEITGGNPTGLTRIPMPISTITDPSTSQTMATGQLAASLTYAYTYVSGGTGTATVYGCGMHNGAYLAAAIANPAASTSGAWLLYEAAFPSGSVLNGANADSGVFAWAYSLA